QVVRRREFLVALEVGDAGVLDHDGVAAVEGKGRRSTEVRAVGEHVDAGVRSAAGRLNENVETGRDLVEAGNDTADPEDRISGRAGGQPISEPVLGIARPDLVQSILELLD